MARSLPKIKVVNVGRDNFFVLKIPVYRSDELQQIRTDTSSIGQEEATAGGHAVKEEELLLGAQQAVAVVIEAFLDGGSNCQIDTKFKLQRLSQDVRA
ncbi:MAG: hypothetical protein FRX49_04887 [Trebouxia sp. A1-2]|nr:MAG: hypothetical protein FRX49_04887 [Trebouxia sp. A1-2]